MCVAYKHILNQLRNRRAVLAPDSTGFLTGATAPLRVRLAVAVALVPCFATVGTGALGSAGLVGDETGRLSFGLGALRNTSSLFHILPVARKYQKTPIAAIGRLIAIDGMSMCDFSGRIPEIKNPATAIQQK